jgi:hypothetical protein
LIRKKKIRLVFKMKEFRCYFVKFSVLLSSF